MDKLSTVKSSSSELQPQLQAVLAGLDVQLETELSRYRRYRRRTPPPETVNHSTAQAEKPAAVLTVDSSNSQLKPDTTTPASTETVLGSVVVPQTAPLATRSPHNSPSETKAPGDYLESSEQLIKSIDQTPRRRRRKRQPSLVASLFTPIGLSSLLLFLLSSIGLGYVVMSPSGRETLGLSRWFGQESSETEAETQAVTEPAEPRSPNLATEEFVELDLDTLSNINPNPNSIPTPANQPTLPTAPNNLTPTAPVSSGPDLGNLTNELIPKPTPVQPQPIQTPTPRPPGGAATRPQSQPIEAEDGYYYVVINYENAGSLNKARTAVPDAYIREFKTGTKVQMGALEDAATARKLAEQLRVQGIAVQFDVPKN